MIYHQLKEFGPKIDMTVVDKIFVEKKYIILLLNCFGLVISILDDNEQDLYNSIKPIMNYMKSEIIIKHVCIYYIKYIDTIKEIFNILTINIVTFEEMFIILKKEYNYSKYINSPIILLNKELSDYNEFIKLMETIFIINMRIDNINIYKIEIYYIDQIDILNISINQIKYNMNKIKYYTFPFNFNRMNNEVKNTFYI